MPWLHAGAKHPNQAGIGHGLISFELRLFAFRVSFVLGALGFCCPSLPNSSEEAGCLVSDEYLMLNKKSSMAIRAGLLE